MKLRGLKGDGEQTAGYIFWCPGCNAAHYVPVTGKMAWTFNGDRECPTFSPSLLINKSRTDPKRPVCHSFIRAGRIQFLGDCTHARAGQTVDIPDFPEDY